MLRMRTLPAGFIAPCLPTKADTLLPYGEAVICDDNGVTSFDHIRYRRNDGDVFLYAFDLIEAQDEECRCAAREAGGRGGWGKRALAISATPQVRNERVQ
jgi:hypothetical protein